MSSQRAVGTRRASSLQSVGMPAPQPVAEERSRTLRECVAAAMDDYFEHLDGQPVTDLYDLVLAEVEVPLLEAVLKETRNNQSRSAAMLGLNRGTLRKKLKKYGLL